MDLLRMCLIASLAFAVLAHTVLSVPIQDFELTDPDFDTMNDDTSMYSPELSRERREAEGSAPGLLNRLRRYVQIHVLRENHMRNSRRRHGERKHRQYRGNYGRYEIAHS